MIEDSIVGVSVDEEDVSIGARDAILRRLRTCALSTRFSVRTTRQHARASITLYDLAGRLARQTKLNGSVLIYALRQMASGYDDVYVFDCLAPATSLPTVPIATFRWVMFPVNHSDIHWTIIFAKVAEARVFFYDPLQSEGFKVQQRQTWTTRCLPVLQSWACRDGSVVGWPADGESVLLEKQHDSCGVYCVAAAFDRMSDTYYFAKQGRVGKSATTQLRVRILWRILLDSVRFDLYEDDTEANRVRAELERYTDERLRLVGPDV